VRETAERNPATAGSTCGRPPALEIVELSESRAIGRQSNAVEVLGLTQLGRPWIERDEPSDERRRFSKILRSLAPGGTLVISGVDAFAAPLMGSRLDARLVRYGLAPDLEVSGSIEHIEPTGMALGVRMLEETTSVHLTAAGATLAGWALAAAGTALALGIAPNTIVSGLERSTTSFEPLRQVYSAWPDDVDLYESVGTNAENLAQALHLLRDAGYARIHTLLSIDEEGAAVGLARLLESRAQTVTLTPCRGGSRRNLDAIDALRVEFQRPGRVFLELDPGRARACANRLARAGDVILHVVHPQAVSGQPRAVYVDHAATGTPRPHFTQDAIERVGLTAGGAARRPY
jgi:hypothetical protein